MEPKKPNRDEILLSKYYDEASAWILWAEAEIKRLKEENESLNNQLLEFGEY